MIRSFERASAALESIADTAAAVFLFVTMMVVVVDVLLRYFFNSPLTWAYDVASMYLMVGLFYLALAPTLSAQGHIGVEVLVQFMPTRARHVAQAAGYAASAALFVLIVVIGAERAWGDFRDNAVTSGVIPWPTWISIAFVPLGSTLISLRLALLVYQHLKAATQRGSAPREPFSTFGGRVE